MGSGNNARPLTLGSFKRLHYSQNINQRDVPPAPTQKSDALWCQHTLKKLLGAGRPPDPQPAAPLQSVMIRTPCNASAMSRLEVALMCDTAELPAHGSVRVWHCFPAWT